MSLKRQSLYMRFIFLKQFEKFAVLFIGFNLIKQLLSHKTISVRQINIFTLWFLGILYQARADLIF